MLNKPDNLFEASRILEEAFWFLYVRMNSIPGINTVADMAEWIRCNWYYGWC